MLKKVIKYEDYNGVQREETFYFNLNKAELAEMELTIEGGLAAKIEAIINTKNIPELTNLFKDIIMKAYGKKSEDGKRFIKSKELSEEFVQTEAYVELFMSLLSNEEAAAQFINNILPKDLVKEATHQVIENK